MPIPPYGDREDVPRNFWTSIVSLFRACAVKLDLDGSDEIRIGEEHYSSERIVSQSSFDNHIYSINLELSVVFRSLFLWFHANSPFSKDTGFSLFLQNGVRIRVFSLSYKTIKQNSYNFCKFSKLLHNIKSAF